MAVGFTTWTVKPHDPIQKLSPRLWRVEGRLSASNRRVMSLVRLGDGRIVIHNAIALEEPAMAEIDAWGEVAAIVIPNSFHRQDAFIMKQRYPRAKVYAPGGSLKAAGKAVPVDGGTYTDIPNDAVLTTRHIAGVGEREGVLLVTDDDGVAAVYCDTLLNIPKMGGLLGFFLHPTGVLSVPRPTTWFLAKDLGALRADLLSVAAIDGLRRIVPGHGAVVDTDTTARLTEAAARI